MFVEFYIFFRRRCRCLRIVFFSRRRKGFDFHDEWMFFQRRRTLTWYHWLVKERNSRNYATLTETSNSTDLNPFDYSVCGILQEKVYKACITDLDPMMMPLMNCCAMTTPSSLASFVLSCSFGSCRLVMHVLYTFFCSISSKAVIKWTQIWWIWRPQLRSDKFCSFFL